MKFVKLLRNIGEHKAGAIIEVDEPIARAYIDAGAAEEHKPAAQALADGVTAEDAELSANLRTMVQSEVRTALQGVTRGLAEAARPNVQISVTESEDDKKLRTGSFQDIGHFAHTLVRGMDPSGPDRDAATMLRDWQGLVARAVTGMSAGSDPEGGLLIPADHAAGIWDKTRDYENLASRIGMTPISGNSLTVNGNAESSRANGSRFGGVQSYWAGEAAQYTGSKPTFYQVNLKLHKITALVYATNELLEDAQALEGYINRVAPAEITFRINDGLTNGTGAGMPLGFLNAPCKVTQTGIATGSAANTICAQNITDMWIRLYAPSRRNAVWVMNQDAEGQLDGLKYTTGSSSGQLVYSPPGGLSGLGYATIKGRPVITIEQAATLGTEGDISLVDFSQFVGITKGGVKSDASIHLRFDYDETVFKFSMRMDAQPMWKTALTPFKGTATQGPIVTLNSTRV